MVRFCLGLGVWLSAAALTAAAPISVYLVAGQSNASGQGVDPPPAALAQQDVPYAFWIKSREAWSVATPPTTLQTLAPYWPQFEWTTYGPELGLAHALRQRGEAVAIVKVSEGGTNAYQWQPGVGYLYGRLVATTQTMLSELQQQGYEPQVRGLAWVQGEADAAQNAWGANNYENHLQTLFTALRAEFGSFPIVLNRLHARHGAPQFPWAATVRTAQDRLPSLLPDVGVITVDDLPFQADGVHFTGASATTIGRRFANWLQPSGDFDFDGDVDLQDLVQYPADGNADGRSDGTDFLLWQRQFRGATVQAVPEPATWLLGVGGALLGFLRRMV